MVLLTNELEEWGGLQSKSADYKEHTDHTAQVCSRLAPLLCLLRWLTDALSLCFDTVGVSSLFYFLSGFGASAPEGSEVRDRSTDAAAGIGWLVSVRVSVMIHTHK